MFSLIIHFVFIHNYAGGAGYDFPDLPATAAATRFLRSFLFALSLRLFVVAASVVLCQSTPLPPSFLLGERRGLVACAGWCDKMTGIVVSMRFNFHSKNASINHSPASMPCTIVALVLMFAAIAGRPSVC
jgi:hypothetical protein